MAPPMATAGAAMAGAVAAAESGLRSGGVAAAALCCFTTRS